ncbi:hypothetical protein WCV47_33810, partial [Klebsiella pneumoniae]|uniref:hypothetical protein n=1 Tax=Klebsiella pneumoniae TaxID=573 RepID=UPI003018B087
YGGIATTIGYIFFPEITGCAVALSFSLRFVIVSNTLRKSKYRFSSENSVLKALSVTHARLGVT